MSRRNRTPYYLSTIILDRWTRRRYPEWSAFDPLANTPYSMCHRFSERKVRSESFARARTPHNRTMQTDENRIGCARDSAARCILVLRTEAVGGLCHLAATSDILDQTF